MFEFDPSKSKSNAAKHAIDFAAAQVLWDDDYLLVVPVMNLDEPRFIAIGRIDVKHWAAIFTVRLGNIRIISVRRARKEEIERYESP